MQRVIAAYERGALSEAELLCRQVLAVKADAIDALNLLGIIAAQTGRTQEAAELLGRAVAVNPANAAAHNNYGNMLQQLGRLDEALASYDRALKLKPDYAEAYNNRGNTLQGLERPDEALESYECALKIRPDDAVAYTNRGAALHELKRRDEALESYDKALKLRPDYAEAYRNRGVTLQALGRPDEALECYNRALKLGPDHAEAYYNRANALQELERLVEALESYDQAVRLKPNHAEAYNNRGNTLYGLKRPDEALASYDQALKLRPDYAEAYNNCGLALQELWRLDEALDAYDRALKIKSDYAEAYNNRGLALQALERPEDALGSYDRALQLNPGYAEAYNNRGVAQQELKRRDEALGSYDRALEIRSDLAEAHYNRGCMLQELKRLEDALGSYDHALKIKPDFAKAYNNRGNVLLERKRLDEALDSFDRALKIRPDFAEAYSNRGLALQEFKRLDEALDSYDRALQIKPDYAEAHSNRGNALRELRRLDQALDSYDRVLKLKPDVEWAYGTWLHTKMKLCAWTDLERQVAALLARVASRERTTAPFALLALTNSLSVQRMAAEIWASAKYPASDALPGMVNRGRREKIRVGYYSADFCEHATAYLMAELFERHDRDRFELFAFSLGPDKKDAMRQRVAAAFDQFIDVQRQSDKEVALQSRVLGIDIAVDLKGFTQDSRPGIFALRAAPLQVSYLGYPGTMGADYMDYLIADRTLIPESSRQHYAEKIAYLPDSYQVNDGKRAIAEQTFTREALGLPRIGVVFCCFNNSYKITPASFAGWMRILEQVEGSVLWLLEDNATAARNLRREAEARGVGAERLVFAPRMPLAEHLARHRAADLFIDTLPCNAHTTASDALWAGLPVLTCLGESFAGRVAASLLNAIELPELVTTTPEQYEALAVALGTDPPQLEEIRRKLERNRLTTPLFDTPRFTRHLEAAYMQMYERYQADLPPDHLHVSS